MSEPESWRGYTALTDGQLAQIAAEIRPTVEALLRLHGLLRRDEPLRIVDGRLAMPEGAPEDFLGWPVDCLIKAAADRLIAEAAAPPTPEGVARC